MKIVEQNNQEENVETKMSQHIIDELGKLDSEFKTAELTLKHKLEVLE